MKLIVFTIGQSPKSDIKQNIYLTKTQVDYIRQDIKDQLKEYDVVPLFICPEVSVVQLLDTESTD